MEKMLVILSEIWLY